MGQSGHFYFVLTRRFVISYAPAVRIDAEVRRIVEECENEATCLLAANRGKLVGLATALLKAELREACEILEVTDLGPAPARAARV